MVFNLFLVSLLSAIGGIVCLIQGFIAQAVFCGMWTVGWFALGVIYSKKE